MATNFPTSVDSFTRPQHGNSRNNNPSEQELWDDTLDAIEAIEGELGTNPSGSEATVAARLTAAEGSVTAEAVTRAAADVALD